MIKEHHPNYKILIPLSNSSFDLKIQYELKDLGILKYSVPEFIKLNTKLMKIIKKIENTEDQNTGSFCLYLKIKE